MSIEILRGRIAQAFDTARVLSLHHLRKFLRCRKSEIPRKKQIEWKISLFERSILGNFCDNDRQKYFTKIYAIIINKGKRRKFESLILQNFCAEESQFYHYITILQKFLGQWKE